MKLTVRETVVFGMLGAVMYMSKMIMEIAPNIHLLGVFTMAFTLVYRKKALYPIYTFVLITGVMNGFAGWWLPYLYLWAALWGVTMLLPKRMPEGVACAVYMAVNALHGFLYGTLYAPAQALMFGLNFEGMVAWIIAGLPFDMIHGVSNFFCALLVLPIVRTLKMIERGSIR